MPELLNLLVTTMPNSTLNPLVSIIIPTRKRPGCAESLLSDLSKQTEDFEVILFNDEQDPETEKLAKQEWPFPVKYLYSQSRSNSCVSRNLCLKEAAGKYIIFLDDDVRVSQDFLNQVLQTFQKFDIFSFVIHEPSRPQRRVFKKLLETLWPGKVFPLFGYFTGGFNYARSAAAWVHHLPGAMMAYKAELCKEVRFDEKIGEGTGYLDDADFSFSVCQKTGAKAWFVPNFKITHLKVPSGGNRQLDPGEWYYHYQLHKLYFFKKHFPGFMPAVLFFSFGECLARSIFTKKNLVGKYFSAYKYAKKS